MLKVEASQVVTYLPDGVTAPRWLGSYGHVRGLNWDFTCPGGANQMNCNIQMDGSWRPDAIDPGRVVHIARGCGSVWEGILDEPTPQPDGWQLTAHGSGTWGTTYLADTRAWYPDYPVDKAISRGLRWHDRGGLDRAGAYIAPFPVPAPRTDPSCGITRGSHTVTDAAVSAADLLSFVSGRGIPPRTFITAVKGGTSFSMSRAATATGTHSISVLPPTTQVRSDSVHLTKGSATATDTSAAIGDPGSIIYGPYLQPETGIVDVVVGTSLRLSKPATRTATVDVVIIKHADPPTSPFSTDITSWINQCTQLSGLLWSIDKYRNLTAFPIPTGAPSRILVTPDPAARTIANDITALIVGFQSSPPGTRGRLLGRTGYTEADNAAGIAKHGRIESFLDLTSLSAPDGTVTGMTYDQAVAQAQHVLNLYIRASFASAFTVRFGQYLTAGGQPVDLGAEQAGTVVRLAYSDSGGVGGEVVPGPVTFVVGQYSFDEDTQLAQVTPLQQFRTDISNIENIIIPGLRRGGG